MNILKEEIIKTKNNFEKYKNDMIREREILLEKLKITESNLIENNNKTELMNAEFSDIILTNKM